MNSIILERGICFECSKQLHMPWLHNVHLYKHNKQLTTPTNNTPRCPEMELQFQNGFSHLSWNHEFCFNMYENKQITGIKELRLAESHLCPGSWAPPVRASWHWQIRWRPPCCQSWGHRPVERHATGGKSAWPGCTSAPWEWHSLSPPADIIGPVRWTYLFENDTPNT